MALKFGKISFLLFLFLLGSFANEDKLTKEDLQKIHNLSTSLYELSQRQIQSQSVNFLYSFIWQHRKIQIKPLLERITLSFDGFSGWRNRPYATNNPDDLRPYTYSGGVLSISILDEKERRSKLEEILKQKKDLLAIIENYLLLKHQQEIIFLRLEIENLKERRLKARVIQGVENLDERLKKFDLILDLNEQNSKLKIQVEKIKLHLLELVKPEFTQELEALL